MYDGPGMSEPTDEDNDDDLEHSEEEIREHFEKFWYDVVPEFKRFGEIEQLRVCRNHSHHLRGNVYIMYRKKEEAMQAHKAFHGRYYAGKKLLIQFSPVVNWKSAVCGLFTRRQCERGKQCNFLHVFSNPNGDLEGREIRDRDRPRSRERDHREHREHRDHRERHHERDRERERRLEEYSSHGYRIDDLNDKEREIERQFAEIVASDRTHSSTVTDRSKRDEKRSDSRSPSDKRSKRHKRSNSLSSSSEERSLSRDRKKRKRYHTKSSK